MWRTLILACLVTLFHSFGLACEVSGSKWELWNGNSPCLRGANIYQQIDSGDPWYPKLVKADFLALRSKNANYVNLSVPGPYGVDSMVLNQENWAMLQTIVEWARQAGLYVVISFRTGPGRGEGDITGEGNPRKTVFQRPSEQQAYANMWKMVANHYKNSPHVVGYDLMVEPHDINRSAWRGFAQTLINEIRSIDTNTPILVSPDEWGDVWSLDGWAPLNGNKLLYTVHQYEPFYYTHGNVPFDPQFSTLKSMYKKIRRWKSSNKSQVVVNEFGSKHASPLVHRFMNRQFNLLERSNLNHAIWLWEVMDPTYTYRVMDFRENGKLYNKVKRNWRKNTVWPK